MVRKVSDVDSSFCLPASYHFLLCSDFIYHFIYFSITSFPRPLPVSVPGSPLFNSPVPPCFPLRSFPNFWSPSGAAWRGLFLSSLPSRQEQHWNWKLCLLSTTTTRRPTNCWSAGGFADSCISCIKTFSLLASWFLIFSLLMLDFCTGCEHGARLGYGGCTNGL